MGCYLGVLINELTCKAVGCMCLGPTFGHWIVEFVSCWAKNYAYCLNTSKVVCKVRGFSFKFFSIPNCKFKSMENALYAW